MSGSTGYTTELVLELLPFIFETELPNGIPSPYEPAPDMPRGSKDTSKSGTWMSLIADIRIAWEEPVLTPTERRRVIRYAQLGGDHGSINLDSHKRTSLSLLADWEGVSRTSVQESIDSAARKLSDVANGLIEGERQ